MRAFFILLFTAALAGFLSGCISPKTCIDGTVLNMCSADTPRYCSTGGLVDDCERCGCPEGAVCAEGGECRGVLEIGPSKMVKKLKLKRMILRKDLPDTPEELDNKTYIPEKLLPEGIISHYQMFVTPEDEEVKRIAASLNSNIEAYDMAVNWVWVSEERLNGETEKWLMPHEFLTKTASYRTNPLKGQPVSDCESQSYTLVSILRARGVPESDVRIVLGEVNFSDEVGGHSWVQLYEGGRWLDLEPTTGPYYDDDENMLVDTEGVPFQYFAVHQYPALEIWRYFNDVYYWDVREKKGNAPEKWKLEREATGSLEALSLP